MVIGRGLRIDGGDVATLDKQDAEVRWLGNKPNLSFCFWYSPFMNGTTLDVISMVSYASGPLIQFDGGNNQIRFYPDRDKAGVYVSQPDTKFSIGTYTFVGASCDYTNGRASLRVGTGVSTLSGATGLACVVGDMALMGAGIFDDFKMEGIFRRVNTAEGTPNLTMLASATGQHKQYDEQVSMTYDSACVVAFPNMTQDIFCFRYVDNSGTRTSTDVGRIVLGVPTSPTTNFSIGYSDISEDRSEKLEAEEADYFLERQLRQAFELAFQNASDVQDEQLEDIFESVKNVRPLVIALDSANDPEETFYVRLRTPYRRTRGINSLSSFTLEFEELL